MEQETSTKGVAVGIDLGTTFSCVAFVRDGHPIVIPDKGRAEKTIPSMVGFDEDGVNVGHLAQLTFESDPASTVFDSKRMFELPFGEASQLGRESSWPFQVIDKKLSHGDFPPVLKVKLTVGGKELEYFPEEISAHVIKRLKENAEHFLNRPVSKAVICVPANFKMHQKEATKVAAQIAGFQLRDILIQNEPTAAAVAYGLENIGGEKTILVYDLGGGTFDSTLMHYEDGLFDVMSTGGCPSIGGRNFDSKMMEEVEEAINHLSLSLNSAQKQKLRLACETAKKFLVDKTKVKIPVEGVFHNGKKFEYPMTRETFNDLNQGLFDATMDSVRQVLKSTKPPTETKDITHVLLVGGSTRIVKIQEMLAQEFPTATICASNPDEIVCSGAAIIADYVFGPNSGKFKTYPLVDVAPSNFGIKLNNGDCSSIIQRNAKLPAIPPPRQYTTSNKEATAIRVAVYEGNFPKVVDNHYVGEFCLNGIQIPAEGQPLIDISFELSKEGLLDVTAVVIKSGIRKKETFETVRKFTPEVIQSLAKKAVRHASGDFSVEVFDLDPDDAEEAAAEVAGNGNQLPLNFMEGDSEEDDGSSCSVPCKKMKVTQGNNSGKQAESNSVLLFPE